MDYIDLACKRPEAALDPCELWGVMEWDSECSNHRALTCRQCEQLIRIIIHLLCNHPHAAQNREAGGSRPVRSGRVP